MNMVRPIGIVVVVATGVAVSSLTALALCLRDNETDIK